VDAAGAVVRPAWPAPDELFILPPGGGALEVQVVGVDACNLVA
jgi:hypothetical protein